MSDTEMHSYVDGVLSPRERSQLEAFLSVCPEERERLDAYRRQNVLLHRLYDWPAHRLLPAGHDVLLRRLYRRIRFQRGIRLASRATTAAAIVALLGGIGWTSLDWSPTPRRGSTAFLDRGMERYALSVSEKDQSAGAPGNVIMHEKDAVRTGDGQSPNRFERQFRAPDLKKAGFTLIGVRPYTLTQGPAIQFLYSNDADRRVTLLLRPSEKGKAPPSAVAERSDLSMVYSEIDNIAYSLVGNVDRKTLLSLAATVLDSFGTVSANIQVPAAPVEADAKPPVPDDAAPKATKPRNEEQDSLPKGQSNTKGTFVPDAKPAQSPSIIKTGLKSQT